MLNRFARFSLAISEIDRCWHKLAAEAMAEYVLTVRMLFILRHFTISQRVSLLRNWVSCVARTKLMYPA